MVASASGVTALGKHGSSAAAAHFAGVDLLASAASVLAPSEACTLGMLALNSSLLNFQSRHPTASEDQGSCRKRGESVGLQEHRRSLKWSTRALVQLLRWRAETAGRCGLALSAATLGR